MIFQGYLKKLYQRNKYIEQSVEKNVELEYLEVKEAFEGVECDLASWYAKVLNRMFVTVFFADLIPIAVVFSFFHMVICYWVEKYRLLRRIKTPIQMGGKLIRGAVDDTVSSIYFFIVMKS